MLFSGNPSLSSRRSRKGFSLLELTVTIVVLSLLASIAFVSFQRTVTRSTDSAAEADLEQIAQSSLKYFIADRDWQDSVEEAVEDTQSSTEGLVFFVVNDDPLNERYSTQHGEVAWTEAPNGDVGFAMRNNNDNCTMSLISDREVTTWTVRENIEDRCAGRFALQGEQEPDVYESSVDPDDIVLVRPATCTVAVSEPAEIEITWTPSEDAETYMLLRDSEDLVELSSSVTDYTDTGLLGNTVYEYEVVAVDVDGYRSAPSNSCALLTVPDQPQGVVAEKTSSEAATIVWQPHIPSPEDDVSYRVYRDELMNPAADLNSSLTNRVVDTDSTSRQTADGIDIFVNLSTPNGSYGDEQILVANRSLDGGFEFFYHNEELHLNYVSGGDIQFANSTEKINLFPTSQGWLRAKVVPGDQVYFYKSTNGVDWESLGSAPASGTIDPSTDDYVIGNLPEALPSWLTEAPKALISKVKVFSLSGETLSSFDAADFDSNTMTATNSFGHQLETEGETVELTGVTRTLSYNGPDITADDTLGTANGQEYRYRVEAYNVSGPSIMSVPAGLPQAASKPTLTNVEPGDRQVAATWTYVPSALGYEVQVQTDSAESEWGTFGNFSEDGYSFDDQNATVPNLINDQPYKFRVRAKDNVGFSAWSEEVSATPFRGVDAPRDLTVSGGYLQGVPSQQLRLNWQPPLNLSADNPVSGYNIWVWPASGARPESPTDVVYGNSTTFIDKGLTNGTLYNVQVSAFYRSQESSAIASSGTPSAQPAPPVIKLSYPIGGPSSFAPSPGALISWHIPTSTGGSSVVDYNLECYAAPGFTNRVVNESIGSSLRSIEVFGLTAGTSYRCRAQTITDLSGPGPWGGLGSTFTAWGPPNKPVITVAEGNRLLTVSWPAVSSSSPSATGRPVSAYVARCFPTGTNPDAASSTNVPHVNGKSSYSVQVSSLAAQREHSCVVTAFNGLTTDSNPKNGTPYREPFKPSPPVLTARPNGQLPPGFDAVWTSQQAAVNNGGRAITNNRIRCTNTRTGAISPDGPDATSPLYFSASKTTYAHNVEDGEPVKCSWRAKNIAGNGQWSDWSNEITPPPRPTTTSPPPATTPPLQPVFPNRNTSANYQYIPVNRYKVIQSGCCVSGGNFTTTVRSGFTSSWSARNWINSNSRTCDQRFDSPCSVSRYVIYQRTRVNPDTVYYTCPGSGVWRSQWYVCYWR